MKYSLTHGITTVVMMLLATVQISAENSQKKEEVFCQTKTECEQFVQALDVQIDELNKKITSSKGKEKIKLFREKQKLEQGRNTILISSKDAEIKEENEKQVKEKEKQAMYDKLIDTVGSIKETLK